MLAHYLIEPEASHDLPVLCGQYLNYEMLTDADCTVITQQHGVGSYFFPSKLLASLAAAKPVITVADESSELAKALAAGRFGINVPPNDPESLARAIRTMAQADRVNARVAAIRNG